MKKKKYKISIDEIFYFNNPEKKIDTYTFPKSMGIVISWSCEEIGFGELTIYQFDNGKIEVDSEAMSKHFVEAILDEYKNIILKNM